MKQLLRIDMNERKATFCEVEEPGRLFCGRSLILL
jgi:hypothetical protein